MIRRSKIFEAQPKGQLAIGLAIAFAGVLAIFGLVFQSSLDVRQKIKLQQTTDYAALLAANVQTINLNRIREVNEKIEVMWKTTNTALAPSFCLMAGFSGFTAPRSRAAIATINTMLGKAYTTCDQACDGYDEHRRKQIMRSYQTIRSELASNILSSVTGANNIAYSRVLDTFLAPSNLPHSLHLALEKKMGSNFRLEDVRRAYLQGELRMQSSSVDSDRYEYNVLNQYQRDPLFIPENEKRMFRYPNYYYADSYDPSTLTPYCELPTPQGPKVSSSEVKVVKKGDYTTHYLTGVEYLPPVSAFENKLNIFVRDPETGEEISGQSGRSIALFRRSMPMETRAAAKPFGGTFPEKGDLSGLISKGTVGEEFQGAKLIGIADRAEIGGQRMSRADNQLVYRDLQGNVIGTIDYVAEDFLH
ncbi:MAG: Tad domain-containing protein [Bdellovibrionota bacterium]